MLFQEWHQDVFLVFGFSESSQHNSIRHVFPRHTQLHGLPFVSWKTPNNNLDASSTFQSDLPTNPPQVAASCLPFFSFMKSPVFGLGSRTASFPGSEKILRYAWEFRRCSELQLKEPKAAHLQLSSAGHSQPRKIIFFREKWRPWFFGAEKWRQKPDRFDTQIWYFQAACCSDLQGWHSRLCPCPAGYD